jgi:glycosyltransferase involved in cell wall biosynthesis
MGLITRIRNKNKRKTARTNDKSKIKKIILFSGGLVGVGGEERLLFEEAKYFEKNDIETHILTFDFKEEVLFNRNYSVNVKQVGHINRNRNMISQFIQKIHNIHALREKIKEIKPDVIISTSAWNCIDLYYATLFTPFAYVTHIHGTIFWFPRDLLKYALIYRKVFNEIRESVVGHKDFISVKPQKSNLTERLLKEIVAIAMYLGVRKAKKIFVLSNQMKWEVNKLYGKGAIVLKGAFPTEILNYNPKQNVKEKLDLENERVILNVNRLDPRKRVDVLIKAFKQIYDKFDDVVLVIGGVGPEEENLKALANELGIQDRVKFVGYIEENELWDYIASCDVFVHPNWADFAIAAYEPLALQKKVVWSTEMEVDEHLADNKHIFAANPNVEDFARAIKEALNTEVTVADDLSIYTWDKYFEMVYGAVIGAANR